MQSNKLASFPPSSPSCLFPSREIILLRTTGFDDKTSAFADRLAREGNRQVVWLVDERKSPVDVGSYEKVSLTEGACAELDLFCSPDFPWRCGDYGLYLARRQYPQATNFWLIEGDVRISGANLGDFFNIFDHHDDIDLIAAHYRPSTSAWYWDHAIAARDSVVHRCLFDVLRVSSPALDRLLKRRQELSKSRVRRLSWPNDESFLATTLSNDGSTCCDLNSFGHLLYTAETLTFHHAFDGNDFTMNQNELTLYHPVLFGEAYDRKVAKLKKIAAGETVSARLRRRVIHHLNIRSGSAPRQAHADKLSPRKRKWRIPGQSKDTGEVSPV